MASVDDVLKKLRAKGRPGQLIGMAQYGMVTDRRLGVSVPEMRKIAKDLGKDHKLAIELWKTKIPDAMIVAGMIDEPERVTDKQMDDWVKDINSWDVCDQVCMNLFEKTPLAWNKILEWSRRDEEFVKRTAFSLVACLASHDRQAEDNRYIKLLPIIEREATDERNFVKKAVNWALRNIGKRNLDLNRAAIETAKRIQLVDSKAARWIASDAIKELESRSVQRRLSK